MARVQLQIHADFSDPSNPPCVVCLQAVAQVRPVGQPFSIRFADQILQLAHPPWHIHCRCVVMPYVDGFEALQRQLARKYLAKLTPSEKRPPPPLVVAS